MEALSRGYREAWSERRNKGQMDRYNMFHRTDKLLQVLIEKQTREINEIQAQY